MNSWPVRIAFITKQAIKQLLCRHHWHTDLIFCSKPKTHRDIRSCQKCRKSETLFSGTRNEWIKHNGFDSCFEDAP